MQEFRKLLICLPLVFCGFLLSVSLQQPVSALLPDLVLLMVFGSIYFLESQFFGMTFAWFLGFVSDKLFDRPLGTTALLYLSVTYFFIILLDDFRRSSPIKQSCFIFFYLLVAKLYFLVLVVRDFSLLISQEGFLNYVSCFSGAILWMLALLMRGKNLNQF